MPDEGRQQLPQTWTAATKAGKGDDLAQALAEQPLETQLTCDHAAQYNVPSDYPVILYGRRLGARLRDKKVFRSRRPWAHQPSSFAQRGNAPDSLSRRSPGS